MCEPAYGILFRFSASQPSLEHALASRRVSGYVSGLRGERLSKPLKVKLIGKIHGVAVTKERIKARLLRVSGLLVFFGGAGGGLELRLQ